MSDLGDFVMTDLIADIERLNTILIAFQEGASDEKRSALYMIERMLNEKQAIIDRFEMESENA
jgi:hypothetical protein